MWKHSAQVLLVGPADRLAERLAAEGIATVTEDSGLTGICRVVGRAEVNDYYDVAVFCDQLSGVDGITAIRALREVAQVNKFVGRTKYVLVESMPELTETVPSRTAADHIFAEHDGLETTLQFVRGVIASRAESGPVTGSLKVRLPGGGL
jgi:CheY-like chemotaxis protein